MSEVIAALLGGVIVIGIYFSVVATWDVICSRRLSKWIIDNANRHPAWRYNPITGEKYDKDD